MICVYIYIYIHTHKLIQLHNNTTKPNDTNLCTSQRPGRSTPSPPIRSLGFEGFDSSRLLIIRGGNSHVRLIL